MKLLAITELYGGRVMTRLSYGLLSFFFGGHQPENRQMVALEFPGLEAFADQDILAWLRAHAGVSTDRREIVELPDTLWRPAVLDDLIDAVNYNWVIWQVAALFNTVELEAFGARWFPELQRRTRETLALPADTTKIKALEDIQDFARRVTYALYVFPNRLYLDMTELMEALDQEQIRLLRQGGFDQARWLALAEELLTPGLSVRLLEEAADALVREGASQEQLWALVEHIRSRQVLKERVTNAHTFWYRLAPHLRLEPTVFDEEIDITQATEQTVLLNWQLIDARRVGRIIPGRAALVLSEPNGRITYIAGQRRLKFQVQRARGRLERMDNTLLVTEAGTGALHKALMEVELLDTLANVDPAQAVERAAALTLPADHPIYRAAAAAPQDPRQARILADLLIELLVGVDADIARNLARAQARANRR